MDYSEKSPIILSLCPGMLGLERGLERACQRLAWNVPNTAAYVEIEAFVIWNLLNQMEKGILAPAPIYTNIKTFIGKPFRGKIHGILGGYPCQPFSHAGERKGTSDTRHLWPYISGIIAATEPVFCFFENVAGHLSMGFDEVYRSLQEMGFAVEAGIYSAEECGAPHQRKRLFILAIKMDNTFGGRYRGPKKEVCTGRCAIELSSKKLANACFLGGAARLSEQEQWYERLSGEFDHSSNQWPAPPGTEQYDFEEPRIKSRLGFSVNGYNFREDLLRMAGNAVVPQTAELAFIDLLKKHYS